MVAVAPILAIFFLKSWLSAIPLAAITLLIAYQHRENIERLINKTESKTTLFK
jgi:glycerol-3-phosphate acyltransferase PlsY